MDEEQDRTYRTKIIRTMPLLLAVMLCIIVIMLQFFIQYTTVHGISMQATLNDGDKLLINKITYKFNEPQRYDIVLFESKSGEYFIKRIIGIPGDTIQIRTNGYVYLDGEQILVDYGFEPIKDGGLASEPVTLGDGEYFVLGDNRNFSNDSRDPEVGIISSDDIVGKAVYCVYPVDRFGRIDDKANDKLSNYMHDK